IIKLYQRITYVFLVLPYNNASYSLLLHLVARECNLEAAYLVHTFGDAHIYSNHLDAVKTQLSRDGYKAPEIRFNSDKSMFDISYEDLEIVDYECHPYIKDRK